MATAVENTGPAHLLDPATGYPAPPLGKPLTNGAALIAFTGKGAASNGSYAYGVGLFVRSDSYQPYVVWTVILKPDGSWVTESGAYRSTIGEGVEAYERRGGKV